MDQLKPKDIYVKEGPLTLDFSQQQALISCYLPIIGPKALALYQFFAFQEDIFEEGPHTHGELLNYLNMGIQDFLDGRQKLEAIGLLETYWHEKNGFLYTLHVPLKSLEFLQDEIFMQLLIDRVGKEAVAALCQLQNKVSIDKKGYHVVSSSFQDKFTLPVETYQANSDVTKEMQQQLVAQTDPKTNFDWTFFKDIVEQLGIKAGRFTREEKQELVHLVDVYSLNELALGNLVAQSSDLITGTFHLKELKRHLTASFNDSLNRKAPMKAVESSSESPQSLKEKGFTDKEIQFIQAVKAYTPLQFLMATKKQLGGYLTTEEQNIIENLSKKKIFPNSVINILIDYVLRMNKNGSLSRGYVDRIANNWAQEKIQTPEDAILKVRMVVEDASKPKIGRKAPVQVKEKLPDWVKNPVKESKVNKEMAKEYEEKLKELRAGKKEKK